MRERKWRQAISLFVLMGLIGALLWGCSSKDNNSSPSPSSASSSEPAASESESASASPADTASEEPMEDVTLSLLIDWNGSEAWGPKDPVGNAVAQRIKEKTGVTLDLRYAKVPEDQQLNTIFATGDLPDLVAAPAWGFDYLKKAAVEEQLMDLTPYFEKYPTLAKNADPNNTPAGYQENLFNVVPGKKFFMYNRYPATPQDVKDWLYGFFVRKDIATQTGIDPQSVRTPEQLQAFLQKIKDLGLKQDGKEIIPLGSFAQGWDLYYLNKMFISTEFNWDNGSPQFSFLTDGYMNNVKYVRNLIANKLIDPEAYSQTDAIATEKITQGQYAVLSGHYYEVYNRIRPFIDKHPEADYVPIGPLNDKSGDPFKFAMVPAGDNAVFLTKNNKNPEASMRLMNYLASDEGWLLTNYGIEGVHYDMVDGKPVAKQEWIDKEKATPGTLTNEGFGAGSVYTFLAGQNRTYSLAGGTFGWQYDEQYKHAQEVAKVLRPNGVEMAKGIQAISVIIGYEKYEEMKPLLDEIFQYKVYQRAIFAKSDAEAASIIEEVRKALDKAGIHDLEKYVADKDKEQEIIKYLNE